MNLTLQKILISLSFCCLTSGVLASLAPQHLVFTYMGDPSTTLTANWQLIGEDQSVDDAVVYYDTVSHAGKVSEYAQHTHGDVFTIKGLPDRSIARVQLTDLKPNTSYYIVVGHGDGSFADEVKVRTIPADDRPLRFVTGGDMGTTEDVRVLLKNAATFDPSFAAIGGDIAYANGKLGSVGEWDKWLTYYTEEMVTADGHTIPMLLAIGNHEVKGAYNKTPEEAPFFFGFFGQDPDKSYFARRFGQNLLLLVLDSGHVAKHESQVEWIGKVLEQHESTPHTSAIYHVPLYPSHRDFMWRFSEQGRQHWAPIFDQYGLTVAFENHDHTFKRSHFIKDGKVVDEGEGTLYIGDGCWGRGVRPIDYELPWYLKTAGSIQHFWVVDCDADSMMYRAVDIDNQVFDVFPDSAPGAKEAREAFAAKSHIYKLPQGIVSSTAIIDDGAAWKGSDVTVTLKNTFEHPVTLELQTKIRGAAVQAIGLPVEALSLQPGESQQFKVSWAPADEKVIKLKRVKLGFEVSLELHHPDYETPVRYSGGPYITIKPSKASSM